MISASHNPAEYNGLKIFGPDGKKISDQTECLFSEFILAEGDSGPHPTDLQSGASFRESLSSATPVSSNRSRKRLSA